MKFIDEIKEGYQKHPMLVTSVGIGCVVLFLYIVLGGSKTSTSSDDGSAETLTPVTVGTSGGTGTSDGSTSTTDDANQLQYELGVTQSNNDLAAVKYQTDAGVQTATINDNTNVLLGQQQLDATKDTNATTLAVTNSNNAVTTRNNDEQNANTSKAIDYSDQENKLNLANQATSIAYNDQEIKQKQTYDFSVSAGQISNQSKALDYNDQEAKMSIAAGSQATQAGIALKSQAISAVQADYSGLKHPHDYVNAVTNTVAGIAGSN